MADDSIPLLLPRYSSSTPPPAADERSTGGIADILQALLVSVAWVFDAQQTFISVFTDAEPTWHCTGPDDAACSSAPSPCGLRDGSWAWDHPKHTWVVSEWGLECAGPAVVGLPASSYFAGCLVGGFALATLADTFLGRKRMLFLACLTMSLAGALTVLSPNVWVYSALRFVCGVGRATVGTSALVLSTEIAGKRSSIIGFFCFTLGFLSLPAMAYVGRGSSWRTLYLWTSVPSFCYSVAVHFLVRESPRWLLVRGRREEAFRALKSTASPDGNIIIDSSFTTLVAVDVFSSMKTLWEKRWAFRRLTAIMTVGFGVGIVYYGMPLNAGNLGSSINPYLSVTFNALAELPSTLATFFLVGVLSRRSSILVLTTVSGACSISCAFVKTEGLRMAAEVASFFSACTAFNVVLIYSIELFPTCVRNSAISMVRQALVLGGVFAPVLVAAGRMHESFLSFGVFGLVIGCCGLFVACLPETRGRSLCDTMDEEEEAEEERRSPLPCNIAYQH